MSNKIIQSYNERLGLVNNIPRKEKLKLIKEIYKYISAYNVIEAAELSNEIVVLFLRNTELLTKDNIDEVKIHLISAFKNISTIANNDLRTGELNTFFFLNKLYSYYNQGSYPTYSKQEEKDFINLLENLEKIKLIFGLTDNDGKNYFPISSLLYNIIKSEDLKNYLNNSETIQTLFLALQIYNYNPNSKEYKDIKRYLKNLNLKFIDYLSEDGTRRIGGENWKDNYEKNGTLVLYSPNSKNVLIRNINKEYFDNIDKIRKEYGMSDIHSEKNNNNDDIAFYVEYNIGQMNVSDLNFININEEIKNDKKDTIKEILKLIYDQNYYNIILDSSLFILNNMVYPVNPFCKNDKYVIYNSDIIKNNSSNCLNAVSKWLEQFGLYVLSGQGINVINLGTLVSLEQISQVNIEALELNDNEVSFDKLLANWLDNCKKNKREAFNEFFKTYKAKLEYIKSNESLLNKKYEDDFFIPYPISMEILKKLDFDERINKQNICEVKCEKSLFDGKQTIKDIDTNDDYSDFVEEYSEEFDKNTLNNTSIKAIVDKDNKKIYFSDDISLYGRYINSINDLNKGAFPCELTLSNADINDIVEMMKSFEVAIREIHNNVLPLKDISIYRIVHHLLLLSKINNNINISNWLKLLKYHQVLKFDNVELPLKSEKGVLYIPKDRGRACSTYKNIYYKYIHKSSIRDSEVFDQMISFNGEHYLVNDVIIKKIVFLFDLVQNGTATIKTIKYQLDNNNESHDKYSQFYCNSNRVRISTIIEKNSPEIMCHCIYASENGIQKVEECFNDIKFEVLPPCNLLDTNKLWDNEKKEICDSIYGTSRFKSTLNVGDYPVIREFNQPKHNIMSDELMDINKAVAIFCKKREI